MTSAHEPCFDTTGSRRDALQRSACGPELIIERLRAYGAALRTDEAELIIAAGEDAAAALIAYAQWLRSNYNVHPRA